MACAPLSNGLTLLYVSQTAEPLPYSTSFFYRVVLNTPEYFFLTFFFLGEDTYATFSLAATMKARQPR